MTIYQRIEDADFLWQSGRNEGALLSALVAFAATSRRVLPNRQEASDAQAFKKLFQELLPSGWSVTFRGKRTSMDELFYKWLRCELVHAGGLPVGLSLDPADKEGVFTVALRVDAPIAISPSWYHSLVLSVVSHPINVDIFPDQEAKVSAMVKDHKANGQRLVGVFDKAENRAPVPAPTRRSGLRVNLSKDD